MRETKRRLETFSFYDRTGLEKHLTKMAEEGWLLEKIGQFFWTYRRIEPKRLTFCTCCFPKASAFDAGPSEEQEIFYDFCQHSGWVLAAASAQLQVFYNERPDPVPIETDPVLEVDAIHRSMRKSMIPSQLLLLAVTTLNVVLYVSQLLDDPVRVLASTSSLFVGFCWLEVFLLVGVEMASYFRWHHKAVLAAERGEFLETKSHRKLQTGCLILLGVGLVYYLLSVFTSGDRMMIAIMTIMICVYTPGLFLLANGVRNFLKRKKASARFNMVVTIASIFVAAYAFVGVMVFGILFSSARGWFAGDEGTYEYDGKTFELHDDELPLTVEDLLDVDYEGYTRERRAEESVFLARLDMEQCPRFDAADYKLMPRLEYTITLVKAPFLYDLCRDTLLNEYKDDDFYWDRDYIAIDAAPWGAAEAYQVKDEEYGLKSQYLLCYRDRFVEIDFWNDWDVTPEQMAIVGERLGRGKP